MIYFFPFTCKTNHVNMRFNLIDMQHAYANMRDNCVNLRITFHVIIIMLHVDTINLA